MLRPQLSASRPHGLRSRPRPCSAVTMPRLGTPAVFTEPALPGALRSPGLGVCDHIYYLPSNDRVPSPLWGGKKYEVSKRMLPALSRAVRPRVVGERLRPKERGLRKSLLLRQPSDGAPRAPAPSTVSSAAER